MKFSAAVARRVVSASPSSFRASTPASNEDFGFPRQHRLTRGSELQAVIREGKRIRTVHLDVRAVASPFDHSRIGLVVPRHQHTAVDRNRLKRRLRELARLELLPALRAERPVDVAIRARREAYDASFDALRADVAAIRERLHDASAA